MNWFWILAGIVGLLTTVGHFSVGRKQFLTPLLESNIAPIPKAILHCVFHYVSAFLILSTAALLMAGSDSFEKESANLMVGFIALNYIVFAIWQLSIARTSGIPNPFFKLFQWVFFVLIAVFSCVGTL